MNLFFKRTTESDIPFYTDCFQNREFQYMIYGDSPLNLIQLKNYIDRNDRDYKFVVTLEKHSENVTIGFVHFYYYNENTYTFVGGLLPKYINSGLGVSASIAALSLLFEIKKHVSIETGIYKHNPRSLKIMLAIGFIITEEKKEKYILLLDNDGFNNDFVLNIRKKINYQLINL